MMLVINDTLTHASSNHVMTLGSSMEIIQKKCGNKTKKIFIKKLSI